MNQTQTQNLQEDDEINLLELAYALRRHIVLILAVSFIGAAIAAMYSMLMITPTYTSSSSILVLTKETTLASLADLQMGSQLTKDYTVLVTSRPVMEQVIDDLDLNMDYVALRKKISVDNPSNTRILTISVVDTDPQRACDITNNLVVRASAFIADKMEVIPPKTIETAVVATRKTAPSNSKNTIIGFMAGLVLSCGVVVVLHLMDDTIKTEEDIERYLELPMLASIPDRKDYINESNSKGKKRLSARR